MHSSTLTRRIAETNSATGGVTGVSDAFASALWAIDHICTCAQGGAVGVNFHGGGPAAYAPIYDNEIVVQSVQPEFYGLLLAALAGAGTFYQTTVAAGSLNVTASAIKSPTNLSVPVINKDLTANLNVSMVQPQSANYVNLVAMTQLSPGATATSLTAGSGVTIREPP